MSINNYDVYIYFILEKEIEKIATLKKAYRNTAFYPQKGRYYVIGVSIDMNVGVF